MQFYFFRFLFYKKPPSPLNTNNTTPSEDNKVSPFNQQFQKKLADLKALNPFMKNPQIFYGVSDEALRNKKESFLKTIKDNSSENPQKPNCTQNPIAHITYTTHMLYAFHVTKEMEKRKLVAFTETERETIKAYENLVKRKYSIYFDIN